MRKTVPRQTGPIPVLRVNVHSSDRQAALPAGLEAGRYKQARPRHRDGLVRPRIPEGPSALVDLEGRALLPVRVSGAPGRARSLQLPCLKARGQ